MNEIEKQSADALSGSKPPFWRRGAAIVVGTLVFAVVAFFGLDYLAETFTHESTDDAFLDADIVSVAPRVSGQVRQVYVKSNQKVAAGDLLLEIDPRDFETEAEHKRAAVESARANVGLLKATVDLFRSQIATAEATAKESVAEAKATQANTEKAQADLKRAEELIQNRTISPQEYDAAKAAAQWAEAKLRSDQEKAASDESKVAQSRAQLEAGLRAWERAQAQTRESEWEEKTAELNLSYTRVFAPTNGYVTKKAVETGDYVQVGQRILALVPEKDLYVTANFKEVQLQNIRVGQPAKVRIDSLQGGPFAGHVESIQAGSGARFSLLPPENAVGNYVKVVQRVPVKIVFDKPLESDHVLGPGMSVVPLVRVASFEVPEVLVALATLVLTVILGMLWWRAAKK